MTINFAYGFAVPEKARKFGVLIVAVVEIENWQQASAWESCASLRWCWR
jgi:hypothetical protein